MFNRKACSARHHSKRFAGLVATAVLFLGIFVSHSPLAGASSGSVICDRADYVCTTAFTSAPSYANWVKSPTGWPWSKFGAGIASLNAYGPHNCTLYAAFRLYQNGLTASPNWIGLGNATDWLKVAIANGVAHDGTPAIGSIAQWTARDGHVAYVEQINAPGYPTPNIVTTDDNYAFTYNGKPQGNDTTEQVRWPGHGWPDNFLHFKDLTVKDLTVVGPDIPHTISGDFNKDGYSDVVAFYNYGHAQIRAWIFRGNPNGVAPPVMIWDSGVGNWEWSSI